MASAQAPELQAQEGSKMSAEEIKTILDNEGSGVAPDEYDELNESEEVKQRRVVLATSMLAACQYFWLGGDQELDRIAEKLGDGSRDVAWRKPFGQSGLLDFFLGVIAIEPLSEALQLHTLRFIGNSCADEDENRARVVEGNHLPSLVRLLEDETLIPFTVPVLYNILVDYEPAQKSALSAGLGHRLIERLSSPTISDYQPFVNYICKTLILLAGHETSPADIHPATVNIPLTLAVSPTFSGDLDDFTSLVGAAAAYLAKESFQRDWVTQEPLQLLLHVTQHASTAFSPEDPDELDTLKTTKSALQGAIADITALDEFPSFNPINGPVAATLLRWLELPNSSLRTVACLSLGNLSRSDEVSTALVHTYQVHVFLATVIANPGTTDPQELHSALSFLKNLAIPAVNKDPLGVLLALSCVPRIYALDTLPQVQFAAVSLTRLLLVKCPANVHKICIRISQDQSSPSHDRTITTMLCEIFKRTDSEPTKLEAARAITMVCRVLHTTSPVQRILGDWISQKGDADDAVLREQFYSKHPLSDPLSFMITQEKWPVLRSEAWFVYALMARSKDGGSVIINVMFSDLATAALIQAVTGKPTSPRSAAVRVGEGSGVVSDSPVAVGPPSANMLGTEEENKPVEPTEAGLRADRENAVVMCQELNRHWGSELPQLRVSLHEDMIKEGTEMIALQRGQP